MGFALNQILAFSSTLLILVRFVSPSTFLLIISTSKYKDFTILSKSKPTGRPHNVDENFFLWNIFSSAERIHDFLVIDQEPLPTETGEPPAYWPASGNLVAKNLSAQYSKGYSHTIQIWIDINTIN